MKKDENWLNGLAEQVRADKKVIKALAERISSSKKAKSLESQVIELLDDANYTKKVLKAIGCMTMTEIAKELGMKSAKSLANELRDVGILYKNKNGEWILNARYCNYNLTEMETVRVRKDVKHYLVWTEKGRMWLHGLANRGLILTAPKPKHKDEPVVNVPENKSRRPVTMEERVSIQNFNLLIVELQEDFKCLVSLSKACLKNLDETEKKLVMGDIRDIHDATSIAMRKLERECYKMLSM